MINNKLKLHKFLNPLKIMDKSNAFKGLQHFKVIKNNR